MISPVASAVKMGKMNLCGHESTTATLGEVYHPFTKNIFHCDMVGITGEYPAS